MKPLAQISFAIALAVLGAGTLSWLGKSSTPTPATSSPAFPQIIADSKAPALAAPLLDRAFTSACLTDNDSFYQETLSFGADGKTTFIRHYFTDAQCKESGKDKSIQEGEYALAEEEAGQMLLTVRNLYNAATADMIPYFEALIRVDNEQLVLQSSPSTSLHYAAIKSI